MPTVPDRAIRRAAAALTLFLLAGPAALAADLHVDSARGNDANDGLSWASAKKSVIAALTEASLSAGPDTVMVARGRYPGSVRVPPETTLLGGFPIGGGLRDWRMNPTVLDGAGVGPVVSLGSGTDASVIDGFGIEGGRSSVTTEGGGITIRDSAARVVSCIVERCVAPVGAGILVDARGLSMLPMIERCIIRANIARAPGGIGLGAGVFVLTDADAPIAMPLLHHSVVQGNIAELPEDGSGITAGGLFVRGRVRVEHCHFRGNGPAGIVIDGPVSSEPGSALVNTEISGSSGDALIVGCGSMPVMLDNCTITGNGGAAIIGRPLGAAAPGGPWQVELRRSIAWGNRVRGLVDAGGCQLTTEIVADSIVEGGHASGTNVIDRDPLFVQGPAMGYYLSSMGSGQATDSVALDAGPALSQDLGLTTFTTRLDSGLDVGLVDWGAHCEPGEGLSVDRGPTSTSLLPHATIEFLPFTDAPSILHDPQLPLLYYNVWGVMTDVHVSKNEALGTIDLTYWTP